MGIDEIVGYSGLAATTHSNQVYKLITVEASFYTLNNITVNITFLRWGIEK